MKNIKCSFELNGQSWNGQQLKRLEYERNLHLLHQLKQHGFDIMDGDKPLDDDDIDYLAMDEAWRMSIETRSRYSGEEVAKKFQNHSKNQMLCGKRLALLWISR